MNRDEFTIRPYCPHDEASAVALWIECGLVVPQNDPIRDIQRKLKVNPEWFLVGEIAGQVIATCMAGYEGHRGWINYLAVAPSHRRESLATQLVREAVHLLKQAGCPKVNLQIRSSNNDVIAFYQTLGFRIDDVVSMGRRLEPDQS